MPKLSVVISYASRIDDFQHVLNGYNQQNFDDFELVIVQGNRNDDNLEELFTEFPDLNIKHKMFEHPNNNWHLYAKLNLGIKNADSDFLVIAGDDIIPHTNYLNYYYSQRDENTVLFSTKFDIWRHNEKEVPNELVNKLITSDFWMYNEFNNSKPMEFIILTDEVEIKPRGSIWPKELYPHPNAGMKCPVPFLQWKNKPWPIVWLNNYDNMNLIGLPHNNMEPHSAGVIQCNLAYHKKHIVEINGYDEDYEGPEWTDADIVYRLHKKGLKFRFIPGCAIWHIAHPARWDWEVERRDDVDNMFPEKRDNFELIRNKGKNIFG